jgi:TonB family protein
MTNHISESWGDVDLFSLFRSPFLLPSIILHALLFFLALRVSIQLTKPELEVPIAVDLAEVRTGSSIDKSIGPAKGPGGPRTPPKLGVLETGSLETTVPNTNNNSEPAPPPPKPVALPGPKVLASDTRHEAVNVKETSADSLVRLPTKESATNLPGSAAADLEANQRSLAGLKGGEGPGIKALKEGAQIPGALRGTGTGIGPYGVPGGSKTGTGLAGNGTGTGTGGGSNTGLKGLSNAEYREYLNQLKKRVQSVWKYPEGITGVQKVTVRFTLDRAGKLVQAEVVDSSDTKLNASAVDAMRRASPFPPIPESLKDLANEPLIMLFEVSNRLRS